MKPTDDRANRLQRLIHQDTFSSAEEARLRDLVEASAAADLSDGTKRAVYASVLSRQDTRGRARALMLRPAVVFTVLLVAAGATAAATLGQRWIEQRNRAAAVAPAAPALAKTDDAPVARVAEARPVVAPDEVPASEPASVRRYANRVRPRSEDPSEVVRAVDVLRNQHDPARAAKLLAQYLAAHPHGALAEEAVALSIEAAAARHDPAAADFARRYLREYPNGRFRQTAEAALRRP
jgi:hypothetical protein